MFRKGGSAEGGITSGLQRQGYSVGERVKDTITEMREVLPARGPKRNFNDFLINFGLNMASASPTGNIFQTSAAQAKDPFAQFQITHVHSFQGDNHAPPGLNIDYMRLKQ